MGVPVVWPATTPDRMRISSASTRAVESPSPRARRLSIRAARAAWSTGTPAAIPSRTAPTPAPWLSPKMVRPRALPKVLFMPCPPGPPRPLVQGDLAALGLFVVEPLGVDFFLGQAGAGGQAQAAVDCPRALAQGFVLDHGQHPQGHALAVEQAGLAAALDPLDGL